MTIHIYQGSLIGPGRLAHSFPIASSAPPIPCVPSAYQLNSSPALDLANALGAHSWPVLLISIVSKKSMNGTAASSGSIAAMSSSGPAVAIEDG